MSSNNPGWVAWGASVDNPGGVAGPAYCYAIEEERDGKPWYFDIKQYVENKEYPPGISDNDKRTLRRLATGFFVSGTILYK